MRGLLAASRWGGNISLCSVLSGGPIEQKLALARNAIPVNRVSGPSPPFLIIHGARDELVPLAQSQALQRKLMRATVEARLIVFPDLGHWFRLDETQMAEVSRFFQTHFAQTP